jgi:hypothetical protein
MSSEDHAAEPTEEVERLPWLEKIEGEAPRKEGAGRRLAGYAIGLVVVVALVIAGMMALRVRPQAPPPQGDLASLGNEVAPIDRPGDRMARAPAPAAKPRPRPVRKAAPAHAASPAKSSDRASALPADRSERRSRKAEILPRERASAGTSAPAAMASRREGPVLQLGAFASRAGAERAWRQIGGGPRFAGARHWIEPARVKGERVFRLRVRAHPSATRCSSPRSCFVVGGRRY